MVSRAHGAQWSPCSTRSRRWSIASRSELVRSLIRHHADPIGHALGVLSGARPRFIDGCWLYVSDRGLSRLVLSRRGYSAITFGHVVVASRDLEPRLWRHELRHVEQYERLGLAFLPTYLRLYAKHGYRDHPLEREADGLDTLTSK